jgi:sugar phosphate isomerase/epimerase
MRLGGPIFHPFDSPQAWAQQVKQLGYRAAYCPLKPGADEATIAAYAQAAREADIIIAEVGAWSNPLSPDKVERARAVELCMQSLWLAERIGAACCVNIAGSRGPVWDGPHPANLTPETFEMIVATTREIIDAIKPTRTCYTLEAMAWMYPDTPENYVRLIQAIDRPGFAVHLDPVNMVSSPQLYYDNTALIRECFARLGPWIRSCHAKDIILGNRLTVHLDEVRPGLGGLDYSTFLSEASRLPQDVPVMLEHLASEEEYAQAAGFILGVARDQGLVV